MPASAHTAPSRLEPQPKFSADRMIGASRKAAWLNTQSGFSLPSGLKRICSKQ